MPEIRRIRPGDGDRLRTLRLAALQSDPTAFGSTFEREYEYPSEAWETRASSSSTGPKQFIAVAEADHEFVGMAGGYSPDDAPNERGLWGMWVAPEWRRQQVGIGLLEEVRKWAVLADADCLTLWVVRSNTAAVTLYENFGFTDTGERQPLPSDPSLVEVELSLRLGTTRESKEA